MKSTLVDVAAAIALGIFLALLERWTDRWISVVLFWSTMFGLATFIAFRSYRGGRHDRRH